jgi:hypothetical protein
VLVHARVEPDLSGWHSDDIDGDAGRRDPSTDGGHPSEIESLTVRTRKPGASLQRAGLLRGGGEGI